MSLYAITQYQNELEKIIQYGGSKKETAICAAFYYLLNEYARSKDLMLIAEISTRNKGGKIITPDGTLKDYIRNDWVIGKAKTKALGIAGTKVSVEKVLQFFGGYERFIQYHQLQHSGFITTLE